MLETVSVFDALEMDNTQARVASRRALALAHNRVERNLGRFLRAAQNEGEFLERLAIVQDEFDGYVATASVEVEHKHPQHIAAALKDHYRLAADKVEFVETPTEEEEEAKKEEVSSSAVTPKQAKKALKRMAKAGRSWKQVTALVPDMLNNSQQYQPQVPDNGMQQGAPMLNESCPHCGGQKQNGVCPTCQGGGNGMPSGTGLGMAPGGSLGPQLASVEGKQGSPLGDEPMAYGQNDQGQYPVMPGDEAHHSCPNCGSMNHQSNPQTGEPECLDCGYTGSANPYGPYSPDSDINHRQRDLGGYGGRDAKTADTYTGDEQRGGHKEVTCPECGGDGKTAGATTCGKCKGKGKVPNFGDSVLDAYFGKTADGQGNPLPLDPNQPFPGGQGGRPNHVRVLQEQGRPTPPQVDEYGRPIVNQGQEHPDPWMDNEPGTTTFPQQWSLPGGLSEGLRGPGGPDNPYRTADQNPNNTDLDGPEPKMDKALWTRDNPGQPDYADGPRHPTKEKDVTEVIGPARNDHELSEIHGQGTHYEKQSLPTQDGDDPFSPSGPSGVPKGESAGTWHGTDGLADPVTNSSLESVKSKADDPDKNPLSDLLQSDWPSQVSVTAAFLQ